MFKKRQDKNQEKGNSKSKTYKYNNNDKSGGSIISGVIHINKAGHGFIDLKNGESVIIPKSETNSAISGDTVKIKLMPARKGKSGSAGRVIEIKKRGTTHIAGVLDCEGTNFFLKPIKNKFPFQVYIKAGHLKGATCGTACIAKIISWQNNETNEFGVSSIVGEITKTFGSRGENETDMSLLLGEALDKPDFETALLKEVRDFKDVDVEYEIKNGRRDYRNLTTFTIDPNSAKDFDDALSIEKDENGTFKVGIHIADVSYYVKENSALDLESYRRGTSIYLVDRTIPMLPERLSNDLCSLKQDVDRLTMSFVVTLNSDGFIKDYWCGESIIKSRRRFTYDEVDIILTNKKGEFYDELEMLKNLSEKLERERSRRGGLVFNRDDIRFNLDDNGKPIEIIREKSSPSHTLIESFMLLANKISAEMIEKRNNGREKFGIYRVHNKPSDSAIYDLILFAKMCGIKTPANLTEAKDIIKNLMKNVAGKSIEPIMTDMVIRSQSKAHYSEKNIGHFGLALKHYTHFTSPIRRYPDLVVHRIIKSILKNKEVAYSAKDLNKIAEHSTEREEKATEAERASNRYKQIEFLEQFISTDRMAMVISMKDTNFKIIDKETLAIVTCESSKKDIKLGDNVNYTLLSADRIQDILVGSIK